VNPLLATCFLCIGVGIGCYAYVLVQLMRETRGRS
jgi:hypothetical protein